MRWTACAVAVSGGPLGGALLLGVLLYNPSFWFDFGARLCNLIRIQVKKRLINLNTQHLSGLSSSQVPMQVKQSEAVLSS